MVRINLVPSNPEFSWIETWIFMCVTEPFLRTDMVKSPGLLLDGRAKKLPSWKTATSYWYLDLRRKAAVYEHLGYFPNPHF